MNEVQHNEDMLDRLVMQCREIIKCDSARITTLQEKMFLVIGFNRNTKDDSDGYWMDETGTKRDFDYVHETVIAYGKTEEELLASVREYKRLCGMTAEEYLIGA